MIPLPFKGYINIGLGILAILFIVIGLYKVNDAGYQRGIAELNKYKLEVAQAVTEQRNRLDAANEYAKKKEAERIAENTKIMNNLKQQIRELENESDKDPRANEPALSESSVMRINKVRVGTDKTNTR